MSKNTGINKKQIVTVAKMLVELAALPDEDQLDTLAHVVKTWLERDGQFSDARRRLWVTAVRSSR